MSSGRRARHFTSERIPRFLGYFERVLEAAGGRFALGKRVSYVDTSLFQVMEGLRYPFPQSMGALEPRIPRLAALTESVRTRPRLAAYLASPRRLPFSTDGVFRHYPELETDAPAAQAGPARRKSPPPARRRRVRGTRHAKH